MKKIQRRITTLLFILTIILLPLITLFSKKEKFSELENRSLKETPHFSFSDWFDKSFMNDFESFVSDHFVGRVKWIKVKINTELTLGKNEINGIYVTDKRLMEKIPQPDYEKIDASTAAINKFASSVNVPVYTMIAPTSAGIYSEILPENAPQLNQKELIGYINNKFDTGISVIDVYDFLYAMKDDYIYYRTDHHWTSFGAYCAYSVAIQKLGFNSIAYSKFNIEHASSEFYGTYFSKTLYDKINPDTIDIYTYNEGSSVISCTENDGVSSQHYKDIYFRQYLDKKDKYSMYLGTNISEVKINTNLESDKKILIFKDSYANSFIPFLTQHYNEIEVLDMRFINNYRDYVDPDDYSQVLLIYNSTTFCEDDNIIKLAY